jgi:hypothetical protein
MRTVRVKMRPIALTLAMVMLTAKLGVAKDNLFKPSHWTILHESKGPELLHQCSRSVPINVTDYWTLDNREVDILEKTFQKVRSIVATECCITGGQVTTLDKFGFQYLGVVIDGKRYIYINAFNIGNPENLDSLYKNWKTSPIVMCDGGDFYWGVLFDIEKRKFSHLSINGIG